ncbi:glycosyltransferase [Novosphingobium sp. Chol11]|uniref:glycosyltransferase n=1 Tax=Novosphingobium sp. Chol11 TaxID=1385763 RepID=UPI0025E4AD1D|nr:glycosyltransferase [Novosphingobium sp. Chol11]
MKRRLLSLATLYPAPGRPGFGRFVARQMQALSARGDWDVTVVNPVGLPPLRIGRYAPLAAIPRIEHEGGVTVHHPRFMLIPALSGRINPALIARAVMPLATRLHAEAPFDLIDAQFFYPDGPAAMRIASALSVPLAIKARGSDIHVWQGQPGALPQMRAAAQAAAAVLSVSAALGRDMTALGLGGDKLNVHYTGLDRDRFFPSPRGSAREAARVLPGLENLGEGPRVLSVGALVPVKGHEIAISAMALLPPEVNLAIVGTGPLEESLRASAAQAGLASRVRFLGNVEHDILPQLLSAASAMVLISQSEGLANAWIEALACGAPIVIPDVGGAREVVTSPAAGRIVARDPAEIAAALADLIANPAPQDEVAACAARFSWAANATALAKIYESVIAGR